MSIPIPGSIGWIDLTVPNASEVRKFYEAVVGWASSEVPMGGYCDYCMAPTAGASPVAGICHARGPNAEMPPQWLIYITVADLAASVARCAEMGGTVLVGPKDLEGYGRLAVIRDPAGAVATLFESAKKETP